MPFLLVCTVAYWVLCSSSVQHPHIWLPNVELLEHRATVFLGSLCLNWTRLCLAWIFIAGVGGVLS